VHSDWGGGGVRRDARIRVASPCRGQGSVAPTHEGADFRPVPSSAVHVDGFLTRSEYAVSPKERADTVATQEILVAIAAAEVVKLIETKGLDYLDRRKAEKFAEERALAMAERRYGAENSGWEYSRMQQGPMCVGYSSPLLLDSASLAWLADVPTAKRTISTAASRTCTHRTARRAHMAYTRAMTPHRRAMAILRLAMVRRCRVMACLRRVIACLHQAMARLRQATAPCRRATTPLPRASANPRCCRTGKVTP
jgi:hypothetical protein